MQSISAVDTAALHARFDAAQSAHIACVLARAEDLALEPEKPENLAAAASLSCPKEAKELADAAFLNLGDAASREYMQREEERVHKGAIAIVVLTRSKRPVPTPAVRREAALAL